MSYPTEEMRRSCAQGLSSWRRTRIGGTHASVTFAEIVVDGFPLDNEAIFEALEAWELINKSTDVKSTTVDLWGGPTAEPWLNQQLEPVRAELQTADWLNRLNKTANQLDEQLYDRILAAILTAQRAAARSIGSRLANQIRRIPAPIQAELGPVDLEAGRPYLTWETTPPPIRAEASIDVAAAILAASEDLADVVENLVADNETDLDSATESEIGQPPPDQPSHAETAAAAASALFSRWLLARYRTDDPTDPEEQQERTEKLPEPPDNLAADIVAVASGVSLVDNLQRDELGQPVGPDGQATGGKPSSSRLFRHLVHPAVRAIQRLGMETVRPVKQFEWVYGPVSERQRPFEPHRRLDGVTWRMDDPDAGIVREPDGDEPSSYRGYYVGDHFGCRCRPPKTTILLEPI